MDDQPLRGLDARHRIDAEPDQGGYRAPLRPTRNRLAAALPLKGAFLLPSKPHRATFKNGCIRAFPSILRLH